MLRATEVTRRRPTLLTDGLKRALRGFGDRFGNGLYGDQQAANAAPRPERVPARADDRSDRGREASSSRRGPNRGPGAGVPGNHHDETHVRYLRKRLVELSRRKRTCSHCGSPLWQADRSGPRRYPLSDYVKRRMKGFFDLLIGDEVHEYKGRGSAQGIAAGVLADACGKSLSLSGTLMGGYSSTLFHLLYRFSPEIRTEFGRSEEHRWITRYGFEEYTVGKPDDEAVEDGRNSRRRKYRKVTRERPGLVPSALFHIIGNSVFLRLADVASGLPPYEELVMLSSMDTEEDSTGLLPAERLQHRVQLELRKKLAAYGEKLGAPFQSSVA